MIANKVHSIISSSDSSMHDKIVALSKLYISIFGGDISGVIGIIGKLVNLYGAGIVFDTLLSIAPYSVTGNNEITGLLFAVARKKFYDEHTPTFPDLSGWAAELEAKIKQIKGERK